MKNYINISEKWGDAIEITVEDYQKQAEAWGLNMEIEERYDGIYVDGEKVAE